MTRQMKNSGIEWIGEIPSEWKLVKMKHCINRRDTGIWGDDKKNDANDSICLRIADFDYKKFIFKDCKEYTIRNYESSIDESFFLQTDDILVEKSGGGEKTPVGRCVIFDKQFKALFANFMERLRCRKTIKPKFFLYILNCFYQNRYTLNYIKQTTGIQNLDLTSMLSNEFVGIPNFHEQQKIADYLDKQCAEIDNVIEKTEQSIEEYKKLKQSVITEAVTKGIRPNRQMKDSGIDWIGEIPTDWEVVKIGRLFSLRNERNHLPSDKVQLLSLYSGCGVFPTGDEGTTNSGNHAQTVLDYKVVKKDDIVVNIILAWMGSFGVSNYNGVVSPAYDVYIPNKIKAIPHYYHYVFRTNGIAGECYKYGRGIMMMRWRTYSTEFKQIMIPFPSLSEQQEIAEYLDAKCAEIDKLIEKKQQIITELETYKKSMIYEYVTGKKEVV